VRDVNEPNIEKPSCEICGATANYQPAGTTKQGKGYEAFWGCPKRETHADKKWAVSDAVWRQTLADRAATAQADAPAAPASAAPAPAKGPMPTAGEVFGHRQPGEDG
jgi:hypothetical protein